jgi:hypothetical protein
MLVMGVASVCDHACMRVGSAMTSACNVSSRHPPTLMYTRKGSTEGWAAMRRFTREMERWTPLRGGGWGGWGDKGVSTNNQRTKQRTAAVTVGC